MTFPHKIFFQFMFKTQRASAQRWLDQNIACTDDSQNILSSIRSLLQVDCARDVAKACGSGSMSGPWFLTSTTVYPAQNGIRLLCFPQCCVGCSTLYPWRTRGYGAVTTHCPKKPLRDAIKPPHWLSQINSSCRITNTCWNTFVASNVYKLQVTTTPSCSQGSFIHPNYFRVCSQSTITQSCIQASFPYIQTTFGYARR